MPPLDTQIALTSKSAVQCHIYKFAKSSNLRFFQEAVDLSFPFFRAEETEDILLFFFGVHSALKLEKLFFFA